MIKAGNYQIEDKGFAVSTEFIGGVSRQTLIAELPAGISDEALEAICAGPVEVLDGEGNVVQTHTGPFKVLSHGLKLTRTSADADVAALTAHVTTLEAELTRTRNEKESAVSQLATLNQQIAVLKAETPVLAPDVMPELASELTKSVTGDADADSL